MHAKQLLEQIWNGSVTAFHSGEKGPIARGIKALIPVETISLRNASRHVVPRVLPETTELLPGVSLGDVLTEELGIDVPFGALVVFEDVGGDTRGAQSSHSIAYTEEEILRYLVPSLGAPATAETAREAEARFEQTASAGFRDGALNARFFGSGPDRTTGDDESRQSSREDRAPS